MFKVSIGGVSCVVLALLGGVAFADSELPYAASIKGPVPKEKMQEVVQKILDEGVAAGWQSSAQCCVYIDGEKVVDAWAGVMDKESKKPIDGDTLLPIFSTEKPVLATAMHIAHDRGLVQYDDPVSKYWPEFMGDGKETLTIRELLAHRAGMPPGFDKERDDLEGHFLNWDYMAKIAATAKPIVVPGTKTGYLSQSYGWYVGVPLTRIFKMPINDLLTEVVLKPAGIEKDFYFSVPDSEMSRCATVYSDKPGDVFVEMNDPRCRRACVPSVFAVSSARGLAKFYMRLAGMDGKTPLIRPETLAEASQPCRWEKEPLPSAEELVSKWQMIFAMGWGAWGDPDDIARIIGQGGIGGSEGYGDVRNRIAIGYTCGTSIATPNHDLRPAIYRACGVRTRHMPRPLYAETPLEDKAPPPPPNPVQLTRKAPPLRAVPKLQVIETTGRGRHPGAFRQVNWVMGEKRVSQQRWPWGSVDSERDHQTLFFQPGDKKHNEVHVKFGLGLMSAEELKKWNLAADETTIVDDEKGEVRYERPYVTNGVLSKLSYVARATGRPGEIEVIWDAGVVEQEPIVHWENKGSKWTFYAGDEAFTYSSDDLVADGMPHIWRTVKNASTVRWGNSEQGCTISGLPEGPCRIEEHAFDWLKGNTCRMLTMHLPRAKGGRILIDMGACPRQEQNANRFPAVNGLDFSLFNGIHFPLPSTRNELRNPSFEQGFCHWTYCPGANGRTEWQQIVDGGLFGKKALLMKTGSTDETHVYQRPSLLFSMPQQLEYRTKYVLSFYAKKASAPLKAGKKVKAIVALGTANRNVGQPGAAGPCGDAEKPEAQFEVTDEWQRFERPFVAGPGGFRCLLGSVNGDVLFDGLQLERGEKATAFVTAPVEAFLVSSAEDNQLKPNEKKNLRVRFTGAPGTAFSADVTISNYYRENVFVETLSGTIGEDGTLTVPLSAASENIGTGVFPVRLDVKAETSDASLQPATFYQRLSVMEPLTKADMKRPTKNLIGTLGWPARYGHSETYARKLREWGVGSISWGGVSQKKKPSIDFELLYNEGIVNVQHAIGQDILRSSKNYNISLFEDRKECFSLRGNNEAGCREFCKLPLNDAQEAELTRAQIAYLEDADPRSALALSWWNEEEGGPGLVRDEKYEDYFRYQKSTYDAIMATGHKFKTTYSSGMSSIVDYKLPILDAYLSTAKKHGVIYDVMTFHAYGFLDGGRLGYMDLDPQIQKIVDIMEKNGYPKDTQIYITEMGNEMQLWIPEWNTLNGDTYLDGQPEYSYGQYEALNAASCARIWIMMMKYAPRVQHTNIWNSRPFIDATFTPLFLCKAMNTFAHLFPDARFAGEVKVGCDARAYVFTRPNMPAIAAVWQTRPTVDTSEEACPTATVRFTSPVRCIDLMENERSVPKDAEGISRFALTWAPLFFEADNAEALLADLKGMKVVFPTGERAVTSEQKGHALAGGEKEVINQQSEQK